jgi:hypothetical protein
LYVALKKTEIPFHWQAKDDQRKGFRFDRAFYLFDKQFYLELETGTQYYKREDVIRKKIEAYMKLEGRFHVLFSIIDGDVPAKVYSDAILEMLADQQRGTQFLTAPHKGLLLNPLGDWLIHPGGNLYSLASVN